MRKKVFFSVYTRMLCFCIASLLVSILIPATFLNMSKFEDMREITLKSFKQKAQQLNDLVNHEDVALEDALAYLGDVNLTEEVIPDLKILDSPLAPEQIAALDRGELVQYFDPFERGKMGAVMKMGDHFIWIKPNLKEGTLGIFLSLQIYVVIVPLLIGVALMAFITVWFMRPIRRISEASKLVARGDFSIQIQERGCDEIAEMTRNFNLMVRELSTNEYLHKDFVSNVSHEFKTPLTAMRGFAKLLMQEDLDDESRREYAAIILEESERLSKLSTNMLKLSELDYEVIGKRKEQYELDEQLRNAVVLLQPQWEARRLELDCDLEPCVFFGDPELMVQVWLNLLSNAVKHSAEGAPLEVRLLKRDDRIRVEIQDHGEGMTEEVKAQIFNRFYKADASRASAGTGLGLSIAKKIVELHGGEIEVSSEPGQGSTFAVTLPMAMEPPKTGKKTASGPTGTR